MLLFGAQHGAAVDGAPIVNGLTVLAKAAETAIKLRRLAGLAVSRRSNYAKPPAQALSEFLDQG
jgi:hypothetical protein